MLQHAQLCIQRCDIGSLNVAVVVVFTPQKPADATNQQPSFQGLLLDVSLKQAIEIIKFGDSYHISAKGI